MSYEADMLRNQMRELKYAVDEAIELLKTDEQITAHGQDAYTILREARGELNKKRDK